MSSSSSSVELQRLAGGNTGGYVGTTESCGSALQHRWTGEGEGRITVLDVRRLPDVVCPQ